MLTLESSLPIKRTISTHETRFTPNELQTRSLKAMNNTTTSYHDYDIHGRDDRGIANANFYVFSFSYRVLSLRVKCARYLFVFLFFPLHTRQFSMASLGQNCPSLSHTPSRARLMTFTEYNMIMGKSVYDGTVFPFWIDFAEDDLNSIIISKGGFRV
jgi:hypothetical protein